MSTDVRILESGQMETPIGDIRFLFLPARDLFERRAGRLRLLARDHYLSDYLAFLAIIAEAQQDALNRFSAMVPPCDDEQIGCREQGRALLDVRALRRDPAWRQGLTMILRKVSQAPLPSATSDALASLMQSGESELEDRADSVLAVDMAGISPQAMPFIAAALQVYWVHMASSMKVEAFSRLEEGGLCPVCGSYPNVGIVHCRGPEHGLRYLSCSLCSSQWHMVRLKCSICESTGGIDYHILEGSNGAVKAESCGDCNYYLKLLYLGKDSQMEATADDLGTLALDILMEKEGKVRRGPNLFLHAGDSSAREENDRQHAGGTLCKYD